MTTTTPADAGEFDGFYRAHFGDTVAMVYTFTADLPEAQDIAQEAFARAWQRWRQVSIYENPVAWVRRVAVNLAHTRWRRLKVATGYLLKQRTEDTPGISPNHVAVVAALRKLPAPQREAIVLHYIADLPVDVVARELDVPVGTVKSWLHRARASMAHDLVIDVEGVIETPPIGAVVKLAKKRQRTRAAVVATILVLLLVGALVAVQLILPTRPPLPITPTPTPVQPTPSPSATSNVDPNDPILGVNWASPVIDLRTPRSGCPSGTVTFSPTEFEGTRGPAGSWPMAQFLQTGVAIGDLTGDGKADAVLRLSCSRGPEVDPSDGWLTLITRAADGSLSQATYLADVANPISYWISDGVLYVDQVDQRQKAGLGRVVTYRWTENAFKNTGTAAGYPPVSDATLAFGGMGQPCAGGWKFRPNLQGPEAPIYFELGRTGHPYVLLNVSCGEIIRLAVLDADGGGYRALASIPLGEVQSPSVTGSKVQVDTGTYTWDGVQFTKVP